MFSYFTELNRKRPPLGELDFVSFTTSALVHAGDDRSVAESLEIAAAHRPQRARVHRATRLTASGRAPSACATIPTAHATIA